MVEFDTGASYVYLKEYEYSNLRPYMTSIEGMNCSGLNCYNTRTCAEIQGEMSSLTIYVDTIAYTIPPEGYLEDIDSNGYKCIVGIGLVNGNLNTILGAVFFRNFFVEFDLENTQIALAANNGNTWNGGKALSGSGAVGGPIADPNPGKEGVIVGPDGQPTDSTSDGMGTAGIIFLVLALVGLAVFIAIFSYSRC